MKGMQRKKSDTICLAMCAQTKTQIASETRRIYKITCLKNGKIYVGVTKRTVPARFAIHISDLKSRKHCNKRLQEDFDLYGPYQFIAETLEVVPRQIAEDTEVVWMAKLGTFFPSKGYNNLGIARIEAMAADPERKKMLDRTAEEDVTEHLASFVFRRSNRGSQRVMVSEFARQFQGQP